jgi:hypothetical protein
MMSEKVLFFKFPILLHADGVVFSGFIAEGDPFCTIFDVVKKDLENVSSGEDLVTKFVAPAFFDKIKGAH